MATKKRRPTAPQTLYRSGAVARMVRMPVATLRIWERRYGAVAPATAPSGHRLYSAADVQRVALLRQLTDHGHAIGAIAALTSTQLRQVAHTHASTAAGVRQQKPLRPGPWRLVVVGAALAQRLKRPDVVRLAGRPLQTLAVFATLAEAAQQTAHPPPGAAADLLLWQAGGLRADARADLQAAQAAWGARQSAVLYGFANAAARSALAGAGAVVAHEPPDDEALGAWLATLNAEPARTNELPNAHPLPDLAWPPALAASPRRFDDATLTEFAGLSSTIACECPRHVAELLMQLSNFEAYSAECANQSPADAALHRYLKQVAGASRALFESALERVAVHEGLVLPG